MKITAESEKDPQAEAIAVAVAKARESKPDAHLEKLRTPLPDGGYVLGVVRVPTEQEWRMVKSKQSENDPTQKASANRLLFNACVVYPTGPELADLLRRYPIMVDTWAGEIAEMAGAIKGTIREKI